MFAEQDLNKAKIQTILLALAIFAVGIVSAVCQLAINVAFAKSGEALTMRLRLMSFSSILRQEISWFDREENNVAFLVNQLTSDAANLKVNRFEIFSFSF